MRYIFLNKMAYIAILTFNLFFIFLKAKIDSFHLFYICIDSILIALSLYHLTLIGIRKLRKWNLQIEIFISSCRIGMMLFIFISGLPLIFGVLVTLMIVFGVPSFYSPVYWSFWRPIHALVGILKGVFPSPLIFLCLSLVILGFAALEYYNLRLLKRYKKELGSRLPQQTEN